MQRHIMQKLLDLLKDMDPQEVPVAAVITRDGEIIAEAVNTREKDQDVFGHAELNAIKEAQEKLATWNLQDCQIYVSLEPCPMCAGAIQQAHISEVYFAAYDYKFGACGSKHMVLPKTTKVQGGILEEEASQILKDFFSLKR